MEQGSKATNYSGQKYVCVLLGASRLKVGGLYIQYNVVINSRALFLYDILGAASLNNRAPSNHGLNGTFHFLRSDASEFSRLAKRVVLLEKPIAFSNARRKHIASYWEMNADG